MRRPCLLAIAGFAFGTNSAKTQTPAPKVSLSFGVDTSVVEVRDIVRLTRAYLAQPDSSAPTRGLWSSKSSIDATFGDPALSIYQGFPATILGISGTGPGDSVFVVKVLHASADSSRKKISALALQRLYAVRSPGSPYGWQFSSPIPRATRNWQRRTQGRITFIYQPGEKQRPDRARRAARFVDSVSRLFGIPSPQGLTAYVTASTDDAWRILGIDFFPDGSGPGTGLGGRFIGHGTLLLGDPAVGEAFMHEFAHAVLDGRLTGSTAIFTEGIAEWLGGHHQYSARETFRMLRDYQRAHPNVTLSEVLNGDAPGGEDATTALYASSGLIIDSIYRRFGLTGLRRFATVKGTPEEVIRLLPDFVANWTQQGADTWWRNETAFAVKSK